MSTVEVTYPLDRLRLVQFRTRRDEDPGSAFSEAAKWIGEHDAGVVGVAIAYSQGVYTLQLTVTLPPWDEVWLTGGQDPVAARYGESAR